MSQQKNIDLSVAIASPKFEIPSNCLEDCPICMEKITGVNISVTTCGHAFHCFCLLTAVESNEECPLCRHPLVKIDYETDEDDDENENGDGDDDEDDSETIHSTSTSSNDDEHSLVTLEQLTTKMSNLGYTMKDLIYMLTPIRSDDPKYTEEYCDELFETVEKIKDGRIPLSQVDTRTYHQALIGTTITPILGSSVEENTTVRELTSEFEEEKKEEEEEQVDIYNEIMLTIDTMIHRLEKNVIKKEKYTWDPSVITY